MKNLYQDRAVKTPRLVTHSVAGMGLMGMILAIVGLYGLMTFSVARRTREIGIRMALGADQRGVVTMIMKQGLGLVALGAGIGFAIGISAYRVIESKLFVSLGTPGLLPFGMITLLLLIATSIAAFVPARHASAIDPVRALRDE
jgi:ABC-type antimicrobial peptide transport system permease subunit